VTAGFMAMEAMRYLSDPDPVRTRIEPARRLVAPQRRQRDFRLESRTLTSSRASCLPRALVPATPPDRKRKIHPTNRFGVYGPSLKNN